MNVRMNSIARYQYHIRSSKRSSGTNTDLNIKLSQLLNLRSVNGLFRVRIEGATVPFSFYQLSSDINTLQVEFTNGGSKTVQLSLTPGNYTTSSILNLLKDQIVATAAISSGGYIGFAATITAVYSSSTGKDTITLAEAGPTIVFRFDLNPDLGRFFGFETSQSLSSTTPITSTKIAVANPVYQLYIRSGNLQQLSNREFIVEQDTFSDIYYTIPITTNQNTYIQMNHEGDDIWIANDSITEMNWYLTTNLSYTPIDLQGLDWSFVFTIDEVERPDYKPRIAAITSLLQPTPPTPVDTVALETQKQELMNKLALYKKKLMRGMPENLLQQIFSPQPGESLVNTNALLS